MRDCFLELTKVVSDFVDLVEDTSENCAPFLLPVHAFLRLGDLFLRLGDLFLPWPGRRGP